MTTYTTIANSEIDQDSPVTQTLMTALRDNPIAITEGAAGAPKVSNAALDPIQTGIIANGAVQRAKIQTGTSSAAGSLSSGGFVSVLVSAYSFFPSFNGDRVVVLTCAETTGSADAPRIGIINNDPDNTKSYSVAWRFINA